MNKLMILLITFYGMPEVLAECKVDSHVLSANYVIQHPDKKQSVKVFDFWRKGDEVGYRYPSKNVTEIWNLLANGKIRPVRYFDEYQKGIEYQPGEVSGSDKSWSSKYQIIPKTLIEKMKKTGSSGQGCELIENYELKQGETYYRLSWYPHYELPQFYAVQSKRIKIAYKLDSLKTDTVEIEQFFNEKLSYQTTDYADIGDNESDPFLRKMINLGFVGHGASGIYNAEGQAIPLRDGHGHHH